MSDENDMQLLNDKLKEHQGYCDWQSLAQHNEKGRVIMVALELDIIKVGTAVAEDNSELVQQWMSEGKLWKPTALETEAWELDPVLEQFLSIIVQPFVLVQHAGVAQ